MTIEKRKDETTTAFTLRRILTEEREACAELAQQIASQYGEGAIGHAIAVEIRKRT